ncbi:pyruvate dehydrogenase complex dihydrolipoamide acetyltransferase [Limoniibacter endophyticus]|uniref:Acetyltransferase component of pyruvate dehydrogenase complex n=1 Tax=Limoniibacter endophyticus TaxID=1565040 RepID=A0A8J3DMA5_9HYPH|nr:pyruvate dehydrogenase complex dihydrolipoamide acetyltransferase [Limoniibacter endophyticus]GHC62995.1 acetyltransferase component of pyruvate dehydrogenase complex [Limoniibacter endophyticus]
MPIKITMPALSPTMEEGNLSKWLKKEGDQIAPGDVLAEIETDKATMEVEAVDEGTLAKIVVPAGAAGVKVNALIAVLAEDGEDVAEAAKAASGHAAPALKQEKAEAASSNGDAKAESPKTDEKTPVKSEAPKQEVAPATRNGVSNRQFATPLARRLAKEAGLDLSSMSGTGPRGRIVKADVEAAAKGGVSKNEATAPVKGEAAAPVASKGMSDDAVFKLYEEGSYELKPHDGMRRTIAKRLVEAKQTVPHFYLSLDCNIDGLMKLRADLNNAAPRRGDGVAYKLSVNDFVIKALALALTDVPAANASWSEQGMLVHKHADVGVAVALDGGLITPIVRKAETKSLSAISNEVKELAARAKDKKLKPEEYQGGTTSVSNLGMFGIKNFSAVINPPQGTILAVGAGEKRAIVTDNDEVKVATMMSVTLSCDHRAVDGALGAELLAAFKSRIENPMSMLV